ncbi:reverse transcriptase domain-containing protein [Tanacetum coccineum]|uniref:adenine phosphoribosyltransferase n=1 Tax=Tanacetum coccineum TaxID=301880 RepID=A0ABQ4ZJI7_9ASTR
MVWVVCKPRNPTTTTRPICLSLPGSSTKYLSSTSLILPPKFRLTLFRPLGRWFLPRSFLTMTFFSSLFWPRRCLRAVESGGVEARGFIFGPPIALAIGAKFVPLRKPRKLPGEVISESYTLEYGTDRLEMHVGAVQPGESVLIVDDLVATGGTLSAAIRLLERVGAEVVECACVIGLPLVKGNWRLNGVPLYALVEPRLSDEIRITPNSDLIKDRPTFVSTDWRHPWDPTLRTLPKSRMTKQGNVTQRTPQAKKQSDQASRQISKQASGSANAPYDLVFTAMGPPLGTTQTTATITSAEGLQRATFTTPPQTVPGTNTTEPPPLPLRNKGPELGADNLTLEGVATELAPSDFNLKTTRLWSPSCKRKQKRDQASLQDDFNCRVRDRLGSRDVHSRLGQRRSPNESPPSSDSRDIGASAAEELARPQKDSLGQRGDPDDHLKIFESAATIENWPQPVWCHMFNSTLVGNARNWFSKLPRRSIDGFEELRRAFRLNFTQRKKCAKNPVELARVKQRQGESTSAYVERYKDECIHVKACPEILKISGFMNGINNPELIKRLNDRVPQTFDELMKRTRNIPGDNPKNRVAVATTLPRARGGRGNHKYNPTDNEPKEIHATEGANIPKATTKATPRRATAWGTDTVSCENQLPYLALHSSYGQKERIGSWRMCVTSLTLTKALSTNSLSTTGDRLEVESYAEYPFKSFLTQAKKCMKKGDFREPTAADKLSTQHKAEIAALPTLDVDPDKEELIMYLSARMGQLAPCLLQIGTRTNTGILRESTHQTGYTPKPDARAIAKVERVARGA